MVRGQRDYGMYAPKEATASVSDMGEVASRLGSIVTYDKRGDVVDLDSFETPLLRWKVTTVGATAYARFDTENCRTGSQSVKLHTHGAALDIIYLNKKVPILLSKSLGIEISFGKLLETQWLIGYLSHYSGTRLSQIGFYIDFNVNRIFVFSTAGAWVEVAAGVKATNAYFFFDTIKVVADFSAEYYKRLLFNSMEYDISTIPLRAINLITSPYLEPQFSLDNQGAVAGDVWLDAYILTQAEP